MPRTVRALALLALIGLLASASLRIHVAETDPGFDRRDARGMLRSDPALLYYLCERVLDAGGLTPADWRADARIEHPDRIDVPATFTVGQEFLVAWCALLLEASGLDVPLHVVAGRLMAVLAASAGIFVLLAAWELSRSAAVAALALVFWLTSPASYRTIGFVLVREDLSLPLFALHLYLVARAARSGRATTFAGAGLAFGAALATWHGAAFLGLLEMLAALAVFLRTGAHPLGRRGAWLLPVAALLPALLVPALSHKGALASPAIAILIGGFASALAARRLPARPVALVVAAAVVLLLGSGDPEFGHVWTVVREKLVHLGRAPHDPAELSFEARMLWQGPFETLGPADALRIFQLPLLLALPLGLHQLLRFARGSARGLDAGAALLLLASLAAAWLVSRAAVLPAVLLPVVAAAALQRLLAWRRGRMAARRAAAGADRRFGTLLALLILPALTLAALVHLLGFRSWLADLERDGLPWYWGTQRRAELVESLRAVETVVPGAEAVAADFMLSPAILAHTGRPIVMQPKWETRASRERVRRFWEAFYHRTPQELRALLVGEWECAWLLVDPRTLWHLRAARRLAGLGEGEAPGEGSLAELLFTRDDAPDPLGYETRWIGSGGQRLMRLDAVGSR